MRLFARLPIVLVCSLLFVFIISNSCGKGGGNTPTPTPTPVEADLVVTTNPADKSNNVPAAITNGQPLTVTVTSAMPSGGIKIDVTAKLETSSSNFFTGGSTSTKTAVNNYTITNVPSGGAACICNITVTSLSKPSNVWVGSFRFANK